MQVSRGLFILNMRISLPYNFLFQQSNAIFQLFMLFSLLGSYFAISTCIDEHSTLMLTSYVVFSLFLLLLQVFMLDALLLVLK